MTGDELRPCNCGDSDPQVKLARPMALLWFVKCMGCGETAPPEDQATYLKSEAILAWNGKISGGECLMVNCRKRAPRGEAMCTEHRD